MMLRSQRWTATLLGLAALLAVLPGTVTAQTRPFAITGVGAGPQGLPLPGQDPRPHWIVGVATQLGLHIGEGTVRTDTAIPDFENGRITGQFGSGSPFVFKGLGGDKLVCNYGRADLGASEPGSFELTILEARDDGSLLVEAQWIAEFVAVPSASTGKFAGVTGSWTMYAFSAPFVLGTSDPVYYSWSGAGLLTFRRR